MIYHGTVLETSGWYGLYWYTKEPSAISCCRSNGASAAARKIRESIFAFLRPDVANPLQAADAQGHEIQIDQRGFDLVTGTEGHPLKVTGAIYDLQAPSAPTQVQIGDLEQSYDRSQRFAHQGHPERKSRERLPEPAAADRIHRPAGPRFAVPHTVSKPHDPEARRNGFWRRQCDASIFRTVRTGPFARVENRLAGRQHRAQFPRRGQVLHPLAPSAECRKFGIHPCLPRSC